MPSWSRASTRLAGALVEDREREHAAQPGQAVRCPSAARPPAPPRCRRYRGSAPRRPPARRAARARCTARRCSVRARPSETIGWAPVSDRSMIDQPAVPEVHLAVTEAVAVPARAVRTAVGEGVGEPVGHGLPVRPSVSACDATHVLPRLLVVVRDPCGPHRQPFRPPPARPRSAGPAARSGRAARCAARPTACRRSGHADRGRSAPHRSPGCAGPRAAAPLCAAMRRCRARHARRARSGCRGTAGRSTPCRAPPSRRRSALLRRHGRGALAADHGGVSWLRAAARELRAGGDRR